MPTTYAHYTFGKDVLEALPKPLRRTIGRRRELYDIGLHGPDILFYYRAIMKNHVNATGYSLHDEFADDFFRHAAQVIRKAPDKNAAFSYICGFICHFALDSECHKYIEKMIQVKGIGHAELEMEFDRLLLAEDSYNPVTYMSARHIRPSKKNAEVIAPFFDGISVKEVRNSLSYMILIHRLLLAPNPLKRWILFRGMKLAGLYDSHHGMVMSLAPNPACREYCRLLKELRAKAVLPAADLILKYQEVVVKDEPLPERFHETFGPGEDWESLPLS